MRWCGYVRFATRRHVAVVNNHRKLAVWQLSQDLIVVVYQLARQLPRDEQFVSIEQLKRAAWSVQNNLAEGNARRGRPERRRFFDISLASLAEVDSMVGTLTRLYHQTQVHAATIETLRRRITAGLLSMSRNGRR